MIALRYTRLMLDAVPGHRANAVERVRTERVLAVGRAFLTVTGLFAIYLDPTEPRRLQAVTYAVLAAYAAYGVVVTYVVYRAAQLSQRQVQGLHAVDVLWTSVLTAVSEGPVSPFFLFFLFVVVAAAFRWAMRETLATAGVVVVIFLAETAVAALGPWRMMTTTAEGELNRILLRASYLLIAGVLLGFLAEQDKRRRSELAALAAVARYPHASSGVGGAVAMLARHLLTTLGARMVAVVLQDNETSRTLLWRVSGRETPAPDDDPSPLELSVTEQRDWLFTDAAHAWEWRRRADGSSATRAAVPGRWPLERRDVGVPPHLTTANDTAVIAANFGFANEWTGRVYVFNPARAGEHTVHLLASMAEHVTPAVTNVFLMRRLRQRASADERARVARELHDGAIQALFGLEMKIEALRRAPDASREKVDATLVELQEAVRHEVQELRDVMQALRPVEIDDTHQLEDVVSALVERFRRDSGISARFVAASQRVNLPQTTAIEIVRIVQEALVNVRKHSGGRNVLVRLESVAGASCRLTVEDDGRGFDFEGRLDAAEMERRSVGPAIIRERARTAKAGLTVESVKGRGARLELVFG
jgi:signal transduction histidine kinase